MSKQASLQKKISSKSKFSNAYSQIGSHKKTVSTLNNNNQVDKIPPGGCISTRNTGLSKKHMTTTTSPINNFKEPKSAKLRLSIGRNLNKTNNP